MIQIAVRQATERRQRPRRHDAISSVREAAIVTWRNQAITLKTGLAARLLAYHGSPGSWPARSQLDGKR